MSDNMSKSPKRQRLWKKWLTVADSNPKIHSPPPNAADYHLPGLVLDAMPERRTGGALGLIEVDLRRENRIEWMEVENSLAEGTPNSLPEFGPITATYPDTPQTLVEESSPGLHEFNSPLQSLILLFTKDKNPLPTPSQAACASLPRLSTPALSVLLPQDKENMPPLSQIPCKRKKLLEQEKLIEDLGKVDEYLQNISRDFGLVGEFLRLMFWSRDPKAGEDLRGTFHCGSVCRLLQGRNTLNIIHIIRKIYQHPNGYPSANSCDDSKSNVPLLSHSIQTLLVSVTLGLLCLLGLLNYVLVGCIEIMYS
ncbi:hypothetical protein PQX77_013734 [Marasmius sp. AFHP31]|nr:hypothetical protein PQX77_013734 [Marasmius sp. AFHP31]